MQLPLFQDSDVEYHDISVSITKSDFWHVLLDGIYPGIAKTKRAAAKKAIGVMELHSGLKFPELEKQICGGRVNE